MTEVIRAWFSQRIQTGDLLTKLQLSISVCSCWFILF